MIDLARNREQGPVKRKEIVTREDIPVSFLENILVTLRRAGLIRTTRGASGGIELNRLPEKIAMIEIVEALEGSLAPTECTDDGDRCCRRRTCEAFQLWNRLYQAQRKILQETFLGDLVGQGREEWVI